MKKHLLLIVPFLLIVLSSKAQITVTQADFAGIGDVISQVTDTLPVVAISPGTAGINQVWDFSLLHNHYSTNWNFVNPTATPFTTSFPMTNLSVSLPGPFYNYLNSSSTSVQLWGFGGNILGDGTQHALVYNNPEKMVQFPATYNSTCNDTSKYDRKFYYGHTVTYAGNNYFIDSVRQKEVNYITGIIDAWGTAVTPDGSFPVLRQNNIKHSIDSIWMRVQLFNLWVSVSTTNKTQQSYGFIGNGIKYALVNISYYPDSNAIKKIDWVRATPVAVSEYGFSNEILTFPNPASDILNFNNSGNENLYAVLFDIEGREIKNIQIAANSIASLAIAEIDNGSYILKIYNNSGEMKSEKIMIIH